MQTGISFSFFIIANCTTTTVAGQKNRQHQLSVITDPLHPNCTLSRDARSGYRSIFEWQNINKLEYQPCSLLFWRQKKKIHSITIITWLLEVKGRTVESLICIVFIILTSVRYVSRQYSTEAYRFPPGGKKNNHRFSVQIPSKAYSYESVVRLKVTE